MAENKNYFTILSGVDLKDKVKQKNGFSYVSWSYAWDAVKKLYPDANFNIHEKIMDEYGNTRPWFDDGKTGWVEVDVTIDGHTSTEMLAIMNFKNQSIPADAITSVDANKSIKRCLVKACGLHGLGLYVYSGEDLPTEMAEVLKRQEECMALIKKKCALSAAAKEKVMTLCKEADENANGDPRLIEDLDVLETLVKQLKAVR